MGAKDREPRLSRYRGLSVVVLYNVNRPHTSLDGLTPNEFANRSKSDHNVNRANL